MTSTRAINAAAGVIHAAMQQGKTLPQTIAYALDSAGLLNSPETAAELEHLRKRFAELEAAAGDGSTRTVDEDPITYALTEEAAAIPGFCRNESPYGRRCDQPSGHEGDHAMADGAGGHFGWPASDDVTPEALHASSGAVIPVPSDDVRPQVAKLQALLAGQREDVNDSPLHHTYAIPRDFPEAYRPFGDPVAHTVIELDLPRGDE